MIKTVLLVILMALNICITAFAEEGAIYRDGCRTVITPYHIRNDVCQQNGTFRVNLNEPISPIDVSMMFGPVLSLKGKNNEPLKLDGYAYREYVFDDAEISVRNHVVVRVKYSRNKPYCDIGSFLSTSQYAVIGITKDSLLQSYGTPKSVHKIVDYELLHYEGVDNYMDAVIDIKTNTLKSVEIGLKGKL